MKHMRRILLVALALSIYAQAKFIPDPIVRYKIDARLDAKAKTIKGHYVLQWHNHTNETIPDLQFHLYLNAFKNNQSTFMKEGGADTRRVPFRNKADSWGYEQVHSLKADGVELAPQLRYISPDDGNTNDQTVARVVLPKPIPPQGTVTIEIDWTSKLPHVFARTGFHDNFFLVAQWFPKIGVYEAAGERHRERGGWNCHQFHSTTEFYADFGTYDVNLTVPRDFEVAASGEERSRKENGDGTTTYNYYQEDIHDFAWTTQPASQVIKVVRWFKASEQVRPEEYREWIAKSHPECRTAASSAACDKYLDEFKLKDVKVTAFIQRDHQHQTDRHFRAVFAGLKWFGLMYGTYPYDVTTVVDPPFGGGGASGMEYPTFFTAGTQYWAPKNGGDPEGVTIHEFGHQFWYGLVANNEFEEPWLDEGFNSYSTTKTIQFEFGNWNKYQRVFGIPVPGQSWLNLPVPRYPWHKVGNIPLGQYWEWVAVNPLRSRIPTYVDSGHWDMMSRGAWQTLDAASYRVQAYGKPELMLHTLEGLLGDKWWPAIRAYHQKFRFKHPDARDFMETLQQETGQDLKWFFDQQLYGTGTLNYAVSFTTGEQRPPSGFVDKDGNPVLADDGAESQSIISEVRVTRLGEQQFPVTVRVKFEDGGETWEHWDGQYRWAKFTYKDKPKIVSAEIDPTFQWRLETARIDDSSLREPVVLASEKWYLRWIIWVQNVLTAFSYFG